MSASPAAPLDPSPVYSLELCEDGCPVRPSLIESESQYQEDDVTEEITADDRAVAAEDDAVTAERLGASLAEVQCDPVWRSLDSLFKALGRQERRALAFS